MNGKSLIILLSVVTSWLTAPLVSRSEWKRFYPSLFFITVVITVESYIAYKRKWWEYPKGSILKYLKDGPYIAGPFFIGTLWILKLTYGNFKKYFLVNAIIDSGFVFVLMYFLEKLNITRLVILKKYQLLSLFLIKALSIYGFQYLVDFKSSYKNRT